MTVQELQKQIRSQEAQLRKMRDQLALMQQQDLEAACVSGEQVIAYQMHTGVKYVCGKSAYMVHARNAWGEHKITQGKKLVITTRNPVKELTELFGVSAYRAPKMNACKI